jgi:hypothetical protein
LKRFIIVQTISERAEKKGNIHWSTSMPATAQTGEENRMSLPKAESEIGITKMQL